VTLQATAGPRSHAGPGRQARPPRTTPSAS
jgi:hypothetical protein